MCLWLQPELKWDGGKGLIGQRALLKTLFKKQRSWESSTGQMNSYVVNSICLYLLLHAKWHPNVPTPQSQVPYGTTVRILQGWGLSSQHRFTPNEVLKGTDRTVLLSAPQRQNPEDSFSRYRADVFASAWILFLFYFSCPVVQSGRIFMEYWVSSLFSCPLQ